MQKWEYKCGHIPKGLSIDLQSLGNDGWELVSVIHREHGDSFYFKRPLQKSNYEIAYELAEKLIDSNSVIMEKL